MLHFGDVRNNVGQRHQPIRSGPAGQDQMAPLALAARDQFPHFLFHEQSMVQRINGFIKDQHVHTLREPLPGPNQQLLGLCPVRGVIVVAVEARA